MFHINKRTQIFHSNNRPCLLVLLVVCLGSWPSVWGWEEPAVSPRNPHEMNSPFAVASVSQDEFVESIQPFLKNYCLQCHSGDDAEGDMTLSEFKSFNDVMADLDSWSNVLDVLDHGDMPPEEEKQPPAKELDFVKSWILDTIAKQSKQPKPLAAIRRLNRVEYENTIRDLFRLSRPCFNNAATIIQTDDYFQPASGKMPRYVLAVSQFNNAHRRHSDLPGVSNLPVDPPVEHGFANDQTSLNLSPLMMEHYFEIATALLNSEEFADISGLWQAMFVPGSTDAEELLGQARSQLSLFLPRAFRRNVVQTEIQRYEQLFETEFAETNSYTESMKTTVSTILISPYFLFRTEFSARKSEDKQAAQFSIASRLSYFLWASMPDDQLFQAAGENRLNNPAELRRQVHRMMDDKRIKSLATDFGMQWLKLQKVVSAKPDKDKYPAYYYFHGMQPPAVSMMVEQLLLFETIMVENRSILEFISADFAYLNRSLIDWYQVNPKKVLGYSPQRENFENFFRIKWPHTHRGGILPSGAMLISTSTTTRSSPVFRGAWILDVVFNQPPPPPPANVPPLEDNQDGEPIPVNVRKKLDQHRKDPACASCHARIDPLGFALERYDAVGRWRNKYDNGDPIDTLGDVDGEVFDGAARLKNVIVRQKHKFVKAFVEHTMKYALGRQLHYSDEPEIRRIADKVVERDCHFDAVIENVVLSQIFRQLPNEN
jgi:hypothetical protein